MFARLIARVRYSLAWHRWFYLGGPPSLSSPSLGRTLDERRRNWRLLMDRWWAREPKPPAA